MKITKYLTFFIVISTINVFAFKTHNNPPKRIILSLDRPERRHSLVDPAMDTLFSQPRFKQRRIISSGGEIVSENSNYKAVLDNRGYLTIYSSIIKSPIWSSSNTRTDQKGTFSLIMQDDGNLVIYSNNKTVVWQSKSAHKGKGYYYELIMQDNGNLGIYDLYSTLIWASNTSERTAITTDSLYSEPADGQVSILKQGQKLTSNNGNYNLNMQSDGNLVLYSKKKNNKATWASAKYGQASPFTAIMQGDGNLVVYESGNPIWTSNTSGKGTPPYKTVIQDDGNLVIYDKSSPIWASGTNKKK